MRVYRSLSDVIDECFASQLKDVEFETCHYYNLTSYILSAANYQSSNHYMYKFTIPPDLVSPILIIACVTVSLL